MEAWQFGKVITCVNRGKFTKWVERFKRGQTSVDDVHSGQPLTCVEINEQIFHHI
jgi:hypothetical protein